MPDALPRPTLFQRFLNLIERIGNVLPNPSTLFALLAGVVVLLSWWLSSIGVKVTHPATGQVVPIVNLCSLEGLQRMLTNVVPNFVGFPPLGTVLACLIGIAVAERTGLITAALRLIVLSAPRRLLTPIVIFGGIMSHSGGDVGYVLMIPLGAAIFHTVGRHPIAGLAAAFAGVSGGFSANPFPSSLDPLLQGITQEATKILDPARGVNPLCNWYFTGAASLLITLVGWFITDKLIEPRLRSVPVDGDPADIPKMGESTPAERRGMWAGVAAIVLGLVAITLAALPDSSPLRAPTGNLTDNAAPLMKAIVPFIFILFLLPGLAHGYVAGVFRSHRDVVKSMAKSMSTMGYYLVMAFFAALFIYAFNKSQIGALLAVKGANLLQAMSLPAQVTIVGIILLCAAVNLLIGSASAKWALLAPILVPMLMQLGLSPELTQAAFRVGDSATNIVTPLMPYFPLVVAFCQRYVKGTGIGTVISLMLPYSISFLVAWTLFLLAFWGAGLPLGIGGVFTYP